MIMKASRRARPDLVAMRPNRIAPNRNQGVVVENPWNAVPNGTTPVTQKKYRPMRPLIATSCACVIHDPIMNAVIASAFCIVGSMPSGANQIASGTPRVSVHNRTWPSGPRFPSSGPWASTGAGVVGNAP